MNFRDFIDYLDRKGKLVKIKKEVNIEYEIATLMKMMDGKPLFFENVSGFDMPIAANILSSRDLVAEGLQIPKNDLIKKMLHAIENPVAPVVGRCIPSHGG